MNTSSHMTCVCSCSAAAVLKWSDDSTVWHSCDRSECILKSLKTARDVEPCTPGPILYDVAFYYPFEEGSADMEYWYKPLALEKPLPKYVLDTHGLSLKCTNLSAECSYCNKYQAVLKFGDRHSCVNNKCMHTALIEYYNTGFCSDVEMCIPGSKRYKVDFSFRRGNKIKTIDAFLLLPDLLPSYGLDKYGVSVQCLDA